jgi:PAS domain S-box-containing protein
MKFLLRRKLLAVLVVAGSVILVAILYLTYRNTLNVIEGAASIERTQEVLIESGHLAMNVKEMQVAGRVYLVTRKESFLDSIPAWERSAEAHVARLRTLISDNPAQIPRVDTLGILLKQRTNMSSLVLASRSGVPEATILQLFEESKSYEDSFQRAIGRFQAEEYRLLRIRKSEGEAIVRQFEWFLIGLILVFVILKIVVFASVRVGESLKVKLTERNASLEKAIREFGDYKYALDESAIVAITDHRGIITHVNDNFCKISKYSREELIGKDHRIVNSGYHTKEFIRNIWQTISTGQVWKGELRNRARDGSIYWVYTSIVPLLNELGRPQQYLAIRSDITERKIADEIKAANMRLEVEIQEKKAELADIFEMMKDAFVILDSDFRYCYVNKRFTEMAQKDGERIIGKYIWDEFPDAVGTPTFHAINDAAKEQRYIGQVDYYPALDIYYENHIYPTSRGLSIVIRDVTAQRRAEKKLQESEHLYRMIASSIPGSAIILIDKDYRYFLIEGDLLEKVGYSKAELLGGKASDVLPRELYEATEPSFRRVFNGETFSAEFNRKGYDLLVKYVPLHDAQGAVYSAMIVSMDVTELKVSQRKVVELNAQLERKIAERTHQLEVVNKELESFSYSVAHDLRSPLRGIAGYSSILSEDHGEKLDEEGKRVLGEIQYNVGKMGSLIDDLLTFSRLGRKEVRKAPVDMQTLVEDVLKEIPGTLADIRRTDLNAAYGDFALLKQVLMNLLSNAIKYSSKRAHPAIKISSSEKEGMILYSVADNGVGFDMKYADKLFGVFQRLHSSEEFEGTGVGLAIVKRIINRHGGDVWADAKEDQGATFYFTLPTIPTEQDIKL